MAVNSNSTAVRKYHEKLTTIRVRFPKADPEHDIPDYAAMIRDRAKECGCIIDKKNGLAEGSANAYILHLIEQDMGIKFKTVRDLRDDLSENGTSETNDESTND